MPSGLLAAGAGAAQGLEALLARQRAEEMLKMQQASQQESMRSNRANEDFRQQQLQETSANRQMQLAQMAQNQSAQQEGRDADRALRSIALRPIGGDVPFAEMQSETSAGAPSALYEKGPGEAPSMEHYGPQLPTIKFKGTSAQQVAERTANTKSDQFDQNIQQKADAASAREEMAKSRLSQQEESLKVRQDIAGMRDSISKRREDRMDSWGAPTVTIQDPSGTTRVISRDQLPKGGAEAPVPPALRTQGVNNDVSTVELERLKTLFKPEYVGPAAGRYNSMKQQIPGVAVDEGFANFSAASVAFRNQVIKAITGAQMSEVEARRIREQIPELTDKPEVWMAKYTQSLKNLQDLGAVLQKRGGGPSSGGQKIGKYLVEIE